MNQKKQYEIDKLKKTEEIDKLKIIKTNNSLKKKKHSAILFLEH